MSGIPIFTESPISSTVKKERATATTSADPPQAAVQVSTVLPAATAPLPPPSIGAFAPQPAPFLPAEPSVNPPTPTIASYPPPPTAASSSIPLSNYGPPPTTTIPPRSNSLTPSIPGSPANLDAPLVPRSRSTSPGRDIPPPPKVGEKMKPASYYSPAATPTYAHQSAAAPSYGQFPYQTGQTPNTATFAQQQQQGLLSPHPNSGLFSPASTQHGAGGSGSGGLTASPAQTPTTATIPAFQNQGNAAAASYEHPPGYVQNPYAADMTPEQRFASSHGARSPTLGDHDGGQAGFKSPNVFSNFAPGSNGSASPALGTGVGGSGGGIGGGIGGGGGGGRGGILDNGSDEGSVWGVVSGWAKTAGKKMSEVEGEVWKRINGDQ